MFREASSVDIPTLRPGQEADQQHTESFLLSDPAAQRYLQDRSGIVRIVSPVSDDKVSFGSGFFFSSDGKIATDYHVINNAVGPIMVNTADGGNYRATVERVRPTTDLAILKVEPHYPGQEFPTLPLAPTAMEMKPGERLYTLGHPQGWHQIFLSPGRLAGQRAGSGALQEKQRQGFGSYLPWSSYVPVNPERPVLDVDHHILPGSSGGPVVDSKGQVIGLVESGKSVVTPIDNLHQMLGNQRSVPAIDYLIPRTINMDGQTAMWGAASVLSGRSWLKPTGLFSLVAPPMVASFGTLSAFRDLPFFVEAMRSGTTAEKVNATIDIGADAMMMMFLPVSRWANVARAAQMSGAGIKLMNNLMSNRQY